MGIFKKSKDDSDFALENIQIEDYEAEAGEATHHPTPSSHGSSRATIKQSYGIEDAIALMRKLPNVNSEITITVVKKTLESANIQVEEIISDAERKEQQIESRTEQLTKEINELQERIAHLNDEITELTTDLKETTKVKELLLLSGNETEKPQSKASAEPPKKPKPEPVSQTNPQGKESVSAADKT